MAEPSRPKYLLMKATKNRRDTFETPVKKSITYHRINKSGQFNHTHLFQFKNIQLLQSDIQTLIWKINTETKKNLLLNALIQLIKRQMEVYHQKTKNRLEKDFRLHSKVIKKINYDIEKIIQKNNEQIANINKLKEEISGKRSERVVFSNLFRKIQIQLKKADLFYQQEIIKSQISRKQPLSYSSLNIKQELIPSQDKTNRYFGQQLSGNGVINEGQTTHFGHHFETNHGKKKRTKNEPKQAISMNGFARYDKGNQKLIARYDKDNQKLIARYDKDNQALIELKFKNIKNKISWLQVQIEKVVLKTGCKDHQQLEALIQNMGNQNSQLEDELEAITQKVAHIEKQQGILLNQKKYTQIVEKNALPKSRLRIRNYMSGQAFSTQNQTKLQLITDQEIITSLMDQFYLVSQDQIQKFDLKVLQLDYKLDQLCLLLPPQQNLLAQQNIPHSPPNQKSINPLINLILQKMEIPIQSQKLHQKTWFCNAYQNELVKFNQKQPKYKSTSPKNSLHSLNPIQKTQTKFR